MLPTVAMTAAPEMTARKTVLAHEARRVARRRSVAAGVARRGQANDRGLTPAASTEITERARRRAGRLGLVFHKAIESLWTAGEFDEALTIFREHKADLSRRTAGRAVSN